MCLEHLSLQAKQNPDCPALVVVSDGERAASIRTNLSLVQLERFAALLHCELTSRVELMQECQVAKLKPVE